MSFEDQGTQTDFKSTEAILMHPQGKRYYLSKKYSSMDHHQKNIRDIECCLTKSDLNVKLNFKAEIHDKLLAGSREHFPSMLYYESKYFPSELVKEKKPHLPSIDTDKILSTLKKSRSILHIRVDDFMVQYGLQRLGIETEKPAAVCKFDVIISINSSAEKAGVILFDRVSKALKKVPKLLLMHCPTFMYSTKSEVYHPAPGLTKERTHRIAFKPYLELSDKLMEVFKEHSTKVQRESITSYFVDVTDYVNQGILQRQIKATAEPGQVSVRHLHKYGEVFFAGQPPTNVINVLDPSSVNYLSQLHFYVDDGTQLWRDQQACFAAELASRVKNKLHLELGVVCRIGIAHNKILSKMISAVDCDRRIHILRSNYSLDFLAGKPFITIPYLNPLAGAKLRAKLPPSADILDYSLQKMQADIGIEHGSSMYDISRGVDHTIVDSFLLPPLIRVGEYILPPERVVDAPNNIIFRISGEMEQRLIEARSQNLYPKSLKLITVSYEHPPRLIEEDISINFTNCVDGLGVSLKLHVLPRVMLKDSAKEPKAIYVGIEAKNFFPLEHTESEVSKNK